MDIQNHNLNALLIGTGEFSFCENAVSEADARTKGYVDFGNITSFSPKPDKQTEDHKGSYRGIVRIDTTAVKQANLDYIIKADEWDKNKLMTAFYATDTGTPFTQAVKAAVAGDSLPFTATPAKPGYWYDLTIAGVRIKEITTAVLTGAALLVENNDYILDRKLGRVRFTSAIAHDVTTSITAPAIATAADVGYRSVLSPLSQVIRTGIGRLVCFDQDNADIVTFEHTGFGCQIYLDGIDDINGDKYSNLSINVHVTTPAGSLLVRNQ